MIASLRGRVLSREPALVVEVGGLGLAVQVSARTAAQVPSPGEGVFLHTHLQVRADGGLVLYGFSSQAERSFFLALNSVDGVGPRLALTILSSSPHEETAQAIRDGDEAYLKRIPGVGSKTSARLVFELKDKLAEIPAAARLTPETSPLFEEAQLALVSLGLTQRAAREAVEKVDRRRLGGALRVEDIVKAALQSGGRARE